MLLHFTRFVREFKSIHYLSKTVLVLSDCTLSEKHELFLDIAFDFLCLNSEHIESDSLGEGSALANSHDITFGNSRECGRAMYSEVVVSLFEPVILLDIMEIISPNDNCSLHLGSNNDSPIHKLFIYAYKYWEKRHSEALQFSA